MSSSTLSHVQRLPDINNRSENIKGKCVPINTAICNTNPISLNQRDTSGWSNNDKALVPVDNTIARHITRDRPSRRLKINDSSITGQVGKPQFLKQLEIYLQNELALLGVSAKHPSERRLQAFREVFENLIKDFKTYKPLLASIKNEYEMLLSSQRQEIRALEPLRQILVTVAEQCEQRLMNFRNEEKIDMMKLNMRNQDLMRQLEDMRNQHTAYQVLIDQLKVELSKEYLKYRDECDARKLLISDINDIRYQQEDMLLTNKDELDDSESGDPVILKIALKKAREDEKAASQRLLIIEATYNDVIPRKEYEILNTTFKDLSGKQEKLTLDFTSLKSDHETLQALYKQTLSERDEFYTASESLRRNATPRPKWNRCADVVVGGHQRWTQLSEGKTSSDQLVQVLLDELAGTGGSDTMGAEDFDPMGLGDGVAAYLRYEEKVRNRRLGKRDCLLTIKDLWSDRCSYVERLKKETPAVSRNAYPEFVRDHFAKRFGSGTAMAAEWAYNVHDALDRFQHDPLVSAFAQSLTGEYDEDLYHLERKMSSDLLEFLTRLDVDNGAVGTLNKLEFQEALGQIYPEISQEKTMSLLGAAEIELQAKDSEDLVYQNLFKVTDEGKVGEFLQELYKQSAEERYQYIDDVKKALLEAGVKSKIKVDDLKKAITLVDRTIDHQDMEHCVCWAFRVASDPSRQKSGIAKESTAEETEQLTRTDADTLDMETLVKRLRNGNVRRVGQK